MSVRKMTGVKKCVKNVNIKIWSYCFSTFTYPCQLLWTPRLCQNTVLWRKNETNEIQYKFTNSSRKRFSTKRKLWFSTFFMRNVYLKLDATVCWKNMINSISACVSLTMVLKLYNSLLSQKFYEFCFWQTFHQFFQIFMMNAHPKIHKVVKSTSFPLVSHTKIILSQCRI